MAQIAPDQPVPASTVAAIRLRELRQRRGMTAKQFVDRCVELGAQGMSVHVIANIETGRREIDVNELLLFALALDVPPGHLLTPSQERPLTLAVTPQVTVEDSELVAQWIRGEKALPQSNGRLFYGFTLEHMTAPGEQTMSEYARVLLQDSVKRIASQYEAEAAEFVTRTREQVAEVLADIADSISEGATSEEVVQALTESQSHLLGGDHPAAKATTAKRHKKPKSTAGQRL